MWFSWFWRKSSDWLNYEKKWNVLSLIWSDRKCYIYPGRVWRFLGSFFSQFSFCFPSPVKCKILKMCCQYLFPFKTPLASRRKFTEQLIKAETRFKLKYVILFFIFIMFNRQVSDPRTKCQCHGLLLDGLTFTVNDWLWRRFECPSHPLTVKVSPSRKSPYVQLQGKYKTPILCHVNKLRATFLPRVLFLWAFSVDYYWLWWISHKSFYPSVDFTSDSIIMLKLEYQQAMAGLVKCLLWNPWLKGQSGFLYICWW
jgi:hypothetical protein